MTTDAARGASPLLLGKGRSVRRKQHTFIDSSFFGAALFAHMEMLDEAKRWADKGIARLATTPGGAPDFADGLGEPRAGRDFTFLPAQYFGAGSPRQAKVLGHHNLPEHPVDEPR